MTDWDEIRRLAADFQHIQLSSTVQRLSERNCVEVVSKLLELKLITVLYTQDGKEYITPQHLAKEILDELYVHGGRINLVELQQLANVDLSHVQNKVEEMVRHDRQLLLVLGQLIDRSYLKQLAEEINDKLQEQGQITIAELTKTYDLPGDLLSEIIQSHLGKVIKGHIDASNRDMLYTDAYIARHRARVRGIFSAITRPISVMNVLSQFQFHERLFFSVLDELIRSGRLAGTLSGRQEKGTYIPSMYSEAQSEWVDSFYKQNGYLEYDAVGRLGITDPRSFIQKRLRNESLVFLSSSCVGPDLIETLDASVDEALSQGSWIDALMLLPSVFSSEDVRQLLCECLKKHPEAILCSDTIVASGSLVSNSSKLFSDSISEKAEQEVKKNPAFFSQGKTSGKISMDDGGTSRENKKESRRKKAAAGSGSTKSGGGTQGREIRTKSTKKKGRGARSQDIDSDDDDDDHETKTGLEFMSTGKIEDVLKKCEQLEDCPDELLAEIAERLYKPLNLQYQEAAKSIFLQASSATGDKRKNAAELEEKVNALWTNVRLFEKAFKYFTDDTNIHLVKHLLKAMGTDLSNLLTIAVASDNMISTPEDEALTAEARQKLIGIIPDPAKSILSKLHTALVGKVLDDFITPLERICGPDHLGILLKKPDKKKERQLLFSHRQALSDQLTHEDDPAMALHLAVTLCFQMYTQSMIHAPGRCVPQIIEFLKGHLPAIQHHDFHLMQELVIRQMKHDDKTETEKETIQTQLIQLLPRIKEIAFSSKKLAQQQDES